jgi:cytochrome c oxidase subunit IV
MKGTKLLLLTIVFVFIDIGINLTHNVHSGWEEKEDLAKALGKLFITPLTLIVIVVVMVISKTVELADKYLSI